MENKPDLTIYKNIIESCFQQLQIRTIVPLLEGYDSFVFDVNDEFIFKFPRRKNLNKQYATEVYLLQYLEDQQQSLLNIPKVVYNWLGGDIYPLRFYGYQKIAGIPLEKKHLNPQISDNIAIQLAQCISSLHAIPVANLKNTLVPYYEISQWIDMFNELQKKVEKILFPYIEPNIQAYISQMFTEYFSWNEKLVFRPTLVHNDLMKGNILFDPNQHKITGIIDFGDGCVGDPARDFAGIKFDFGIPFAKQTFDLYQGTIDKYFWNRVCFYEKCVPFYIMDYGLVTKSEKHLKQGLEYLKSQYNSDKN